MIRNLSFLFLIKFSCESPIGGALFFSDRPDCPLTPGLSDFLKPNVTKFEKCFRGELGVICANPKTCSLLGLEYDAKTDYYPKIKPNSTSNVLAAMKKSCGVRPSAGLTLAVTGSGKLNAPWAVSIGQTGEYFENNFDHHCTGSLLAPGIVLSAAHCITSGYFDRESFRVRAGVQNLKSRFAIERKIRKSVFHSKWQRSDKKEIYFDVCLIFLKTPFTLSPSLQPICLPSKTYPALPEEMVGYGVTSVGWGRNNEDNYGEGLTQIDVTIRGHAECNYKYNQTDRKDMIRIKTQLPRLLISSQFCADNNVDTGIGTCHGDSGGPSFTRSFRNGKERFTIFGVTSGSVACGGSLPDFYTFLAHEEILPWIDTAASEDEAEFSEFYHLNENSWVHCETGSECYSGNCQEGLCITPLTLSESQRLGPSSRCTEKITPCYNGTECTAPRCNIYGNSCWCPQTSGNILTNSTCPPPLCKAIGKCCRLKTSPDGRLHCPNSC